MRYLRNGFGLFPVIAVGAHITLFAGLRAGGIVRGDPLIIMAGYSDGLNFLVGTPGARAFLLTRIDTIGFIGDLPITGIMPEFSIGFRFFPVIAVGAHIALFTTLLAGGRAYSDPQIGMGLQGQGLGFLIGTPGALALLLAGIDAVGFMGGGPAAHGMAELCNGFGFFIGASGPGTAANLLAVARAGGGGGCGPAAHGMGDFRNGFPSVHSITVCADVDFFTCLGARGAA